MALHGAEPKIGDVLAGKYRVERVLGRGGMGVVFAATHVTLGHQVAIKLLLASEALDTEAIARFFREAKVTARLKSIHVAKTLDMGQLDDGQPFLVMELLDGRDLGAELEARGPLPQEEVVTWVLQVCEGVAEAHATGIVHRDLKPANLFLTRDAAGAELVKVLDFGISKLTTETDSHLTTAKSAFGSPTYMSPEQMRSTKATDARSDIWSIGVILYELLTGKVPFEGETVFALAAQVMNDVPPPLETFRRDVSSALSALVMRCLAKRADERPQSVADLADALQPFGGSGSRERAERVRSALGRAAYELPRREQSHPSLAPTEPSGPSLFPPGASPDASDQWAAARTRRDAFTAPSRERVRFGLGIATAVVATAVLGGIVWGAVLRRPAEAPDAATALAPLASEPLPSGSFDAGLRVAEPAPAPGIADASAPVATKVGDPVRPKAKPKNTTPSVAPVRTAEPTHAAPTPFIDERSN